MDSTSDPTLVAQLDAMKKWRDRFFHLAALHWVQPEAEFRIDYSGESQDEYFTALVKFLDDRGDDNDNSCYKAWNG